MNKNINTKKSKAKEIANILLAMVCIGNISGVTKVDAAALAPITRVIAVPGSNEDQLIEAVRNGYLVEVERLLNETGIDVNARDTRDMAALHWAAYSADIELMRKLLRSKANANITSRNGVTVLHLLVANLTGEVAEGRNDEVRSEMVQELVAAGAEVNAVTNDGKTALDIAAHNGYIRVAARLIDAGGLIGGNLSTVRTAEEVLLEGARENNIELVRRCLATRGVNVNAKDRFRRTVLHYLAFNDHVAEVVILIAAGADVDAAGEDGMTPLHWAAQGGALDSAKVLIDSGVDLSAFDKLGLKALDYTDQYGYNEISELIKEAQLVYSSSIRARAKACFGRVVKQIKKVGNGATGYLNRLNLKIGKCLDCVPIRVLFDIMSNPASIDLLFYLLGLRYINAI